MKKMYPAVVNSPKTELPEAITSTQTDITVANVAVLLTGEGIATIGNGDVAETIIYTSIEENTLKGCIRGYQGGARSWTAGTRVARNFAAADWDAARDNITELAERLDTPERASITLQPGVHVVNANQDAAFKLAGLQGRTVLNYQSQIGIYGVLNPYVIRYGTNLIPPLYEWSTAVIGAGKTSVVSPYELYQYSKDGDNYVTSSTRIPVKPGVTYTLSAEIIKTPNTATDALFFYWEGADGNRLPGEGAATRKYRGTYVVPADAVNIQLFAVMDVTNDGSAYKTQIIKNLMLNIGSTALPFTSRQDSMLALQTELHANPDNGANPDTVFERDGQYFKLAKWRKVILDGSITFAPFGSATGLKVVNAMLPGPPAVDGSGTLTKYQGKVIKETDYNTVNSAPDNLNIGSSGANGVFDNFQISISNVDSGWGASYNPSDDEIKAYFLGWKICDGVQAINTYNGTGTRYWVYRNNGVSGSLNSDYSGVTTTLPTTLAPNWTPYQFLYQLATPVVEPLTSEGQLTFIDGDNQIEVGTGIVLRESVKPALLTPDNNYYVNSQAAATKLAYKVSKFIYVYANSRQVYDWSTSTNADSWGAQRLYKNSKNFDSTQSYSVTYLMLDKYPAVDITGTYAKNEKALLLDTVKSIQENTTRISVLESKKAEKDNPAWITATLINGATGSLQYKKLTDGLVVFRGLPKAVVNGTIAKLPIGYRPASNLQIGVLSSNTSNTVQCWVQIGSNGDVTVSNFGTEWISLSGIAYLAEQ